MESFHVSDRVAQLEARLRRLEHLSQHSLHLDEDKATDDDNDDYYYYEAPPDEAPPDVMPPDNETPPSSRASPRPSFQEEEDQEEEEEEDQEEEEAAAASSKVVVLPRKASARRVRGRRLGDRHDRASAERDRMFRQVVEALESPSIFLVMAVRGAVEDEIHWKTRVTSNVLASIVFLVQTFFSTWFVFNYTFRRNPSLIAPGYQPSHASHLRVRWLHSFTMEFVSAVFLTYLIWTVWQRRTLRVFRFFLKFGDAANLRPWVLYVGFFNQVVVMYGVILMTYILFRLAPRPHDILLNAMALEYVADFDKSIVQSFSYQPDLRALLVCAQRDLAALADTRLCEACAELRDLELASTSTLLASFFFKSVVGAGGKKIPKKKTLIFTHAPQQRLMELVSRANVQLYAFVSFGLWLLAFTGGHIAHSHVVNVLWFFGLVRDRAKPETERRPLKDTMKGGRDMQYAAPVVIMTSAVYAILCLAHYLVCRDDDGGTRETDPTIFAESSSSSPSTRSRWSQRNAVLTSLRGDDPRPRRSPSAAAHEERRRSKRRNVLERLDIPSSFMITCDDDKDDDKEPNDDQV